MKEENNDDEIDDDSWALYADASYGNSVIESDTNIELEPKKEEEWFDGDDFEFELSSNGASILDAAIEAGADVPFSCKGGVCSVCKAKVMEGSAAMDMNYSLAEDDVEEGFILTCQAHPTSANIFVDYDEM